MTGSKTSRQKRTSPSVTPIQSPNTAAIAKPTSVAESVAQRLPQNQSLPATASNACTGVAT